VDGIPLHRHSPATVDTLLKDLARLSSRGSTETNNRCFLQRSSPVQGKVHPPSLDTLRPNHRTQLRQQDSIRRHRQAPRTTDEYLVTMDTAKHPRTGHTPTGIPQAILTIPDGIHQGRTWQGGALTTGDLQLCDAGSVYITNQCTCPRGCVCSPLTTVSPSCKLISLIFFFIICMLSLIDNRFIYTAILSHIPHRILLFRWTNSLTDCARGLGDLLLYSHTPRCGCCTVDTLETLLV